MRALDEDGNLAGARGTEQAAVEDERAPGGAVLDERAPKLRAEPGGRQQVAMARASLGVAAGRLAHRRRLAPGAGERLELVDVLDRVLVVGQDLEAVGEILEPML